MTRIENWPRIFVRNLDDEQVQQEITEQGRGEIAKWRYKDTDVRCVHLYEANATNPYIVELRGIDYEPPEAGRYETRQEGGAANKQLMRNHTDLVLSEEPVDIRPDF